jgi:hypothetical protein
LDLRDEQQLSLIQELAGRFGHEYRALPRGPQPPGRFTLDNPLLPAGDARMLYALVRHRRPGTFFEIGGGWSTLVAGLAMRRNAEEAGGEAGRIVVNEPYPGPHLTAGLPDNATLHARLAQDVPIDDMLALQPGDILFIDSSHIAKVGSDVLYLMLEVLPRMPRGVLIHIHDIWLPDEYPRELVLKKLFFFNEQYLLQCFLSFNDAFVVRLAGHYLASRHAAAFSEAFGETEAASFWLERAD